MKLISILSLAVLLMWTSRAQARTEDGGLTVHEWGTFLSMSGSDGVSLDGMYHEEHALPAFVHSRSRDQVRIRSAVVKGETPVIYFYTDVPRDVSVRVNFPTGIWTQWYPQAALVGPGIAAAGLPPDARHGHLRWSVRVMPPRELRNPRLPPTSPEVLWRYARQVDSAYVRTSETSGGETERFLFYRGLGTTDMPLEARYGGNGTVSLSASVEAPVRHLFVVRVENGRGAYRYIDQLRPGESVSNILPALDRAKPLSAFTADIADDLASRLTACGLFPQEARAMVNTWRTSYFGTDGIRILCVLPQSWTDRFIPITVTPKPNRIIRVMVGRTELMTPQREQRAESSVRDLGSPNAATRERAYAFLRDQGRYVEPILRRVERTTADSATKTLCARLLLTDFVTGLRTATRSASDGSKIVERPVFVRAQLAILLRDVGLNDEARIEGEMALAALKRVEKPGDDSSGARHHLRAYARAWEAVGDDHAAMDGYARLIRFGSQTKTCSNCHFEEGPRNMAWYRDWWAGKRYAATVKRLGLTSRTIQQHKDRLAAAPNDTATQMMMAYLLAEQGDESQAVSLWSTIEGRPERVAEAGKVRQSDAIPTNERGGASRKEQAPERGK
jgi:hypothetical protein